MGDCDSCAMWREHYYWNHMSDEKKQFLVVASGDFSHSLRIPQEVGSHLRNMIPESELVKLEAPNGRLYPVEVSRELGAIVLRSGWNDFANAHHIEENNSILFVYRGNSCFKVNVFNSVGHEKYLSCSKPPSGIFASVPPRAPCALHVVKEEAVPNPGHVQTSTDFDYTMLPGCCLTKAQDEKVLQMAHTMRSEIPLYVAVMNKSNVSLKNCYVYIPLKLVDNFKEERTKDIVQLQGPDKTVCAVGASKHTDDLIVLNSGWNTFVASQRIQENDLLIFRSKEKSRVEVLILDQSGRGKTSPCSVEGNSSSSDQEMFDDSLQIVSPPPPQIIDLTSSDDEDDVVREGAKEPCRVQKRVTRSCTKTQKMASTSSPSPKSGYGARKPYDRASVKLGVGSEPLSNLQGPYRRPYILGRLATLPLQLEKKVEEKFQSIRCEVPVFVKVMTTTNVHATHRSPCVMVFCVEYASACLPDKTQPLLFQLDVGGKQWPAMLRVARKKWQVYPGWMEFAVDNQLKAGDVCLFHLASSSNGSLTMTVHLVRKSELEQ
ncbi:hypothetical protein QYE76_029918 [Lolium multiflorum]|uniref:TF-B3 domain-containing protein n=1 Tax=Lolium multiflorum TaxID=4521 RepID=A0AAD8VIS0_LOLMU|nr:hypothetical protein QYE76_029918 [Lolium multiflorum]